MSAPLNLLKEKLIQQLAYIYKDVSLTDSFSDIAQALIDIMRLSTTTQAPEPFKNHWSEKDIILITYGDSIISNSQPPLKTLKTFLDKTVKNTINSTHILPFFPYSSDDGFAVIDYSSVNESLGTWQDIKAISENYHLMSDLVINHCSKSSLVLWLSAGKVPTTPFLQPLITNSGPETKNIGAITTGIVS